MAENEKKTNLCSRKMKECLVEGCATEAAYLRSLCACLRRQTARGFRVNACSPDKNKKNCSVALCTQNENEKTLHYPSLLSSLLSHTLRNGLAFLSLPARATKENEIKNSWSHEQNKKNIFVRPRACAKQKNKISAAPPNVMVCSFVV